MLSALCRRVIAAFISTGLVSSSKNISIDDTNISAIIYTGVWSHSPPLGSRDTEWNSTVTTSNVTGSSATLTFNGMFVSLMCIDMVYLVAKGSAVYLIGFKQPQGAKYTVTLDSDPPVQLNANGPATPTNTTLWSQENLPKNS